MRGWARRIVGDADGGAEGRREGRCDGVTLGRPVGRCEGAGLAVGAPLGKREGAAETVGCGLTLGRPEGAALTVGVSLGGALGVTLGRTERLGRGEGGSLGDADGAAVGLPEGDAVGRSLGDAEGWGLVVGSADGGWVGSVLGEDETVGAPEGRSVGAAEGARVPEDGATVLLLLLLTKDGAKVGNIVGACPRTDKGNAHKTSHAVVTRQGARFQDSLGGRRRRRWDVRGRRCRVVVVVVILSKLFSVVLALPFLLEEGLASSPPFSLAREECERSRPMENRRGRRVGRDDDEKNPTTTCSSNLPSQSSSY
jgi:hypothetical protein